MAEKASERPVSAKTGSENRSMAVRKKTKAEQEQEAYMARQYAIVIGELKAAEARNRIRATRLRFIKSHREEIDQIIAFQPNALSALRFEAFMTNKPTSQKDKSSSASSVLSTPRTATSPGGSRDPLTQIERRRVQNLLLDDQNLLIDRTN